MTAGQVARKLFKGNGHTYEEELSKQVRIKRDINLHGYPYAFKHDAILTIGKYKWLRENKKLRGEY